jgi:peptide/nickel transport system substrate-binding protein
MGRIDRRDFLKSSLAVTATAALARPALAQSDARPVLRIAVQKISNGASLSPLREQSNLGNRIFYSFFEPLIEVNRQTDLARRPGLATEWHRVDDRTVELKLRQGVKFHNGEELTSEDVTFTYGPEHMFGTGHEQAKALFTTAVGQAGQGIPPEVPAVARRLWPHLDRVEAVDPYTVRFVNKVPDATLEGRLARYGAEIISKRGFTDAPDWVTWSRKPIGSGPYKVAEFKPDSVLVLDAFDEYWGGKPPARQIRFIVVPEVASRVNGLLSGEFDLITDVPPDQMKTIDDDAQCETIGGPINNHRMLCFDKHLPQLKDPRVRRAITHAIDRNLIVDAIWANRTEVPKGLQWPFYGDMFIADWSVPAHDPELAKKLLKEAGYKGEPIPFRVLNNYYTNQVATAQILVEMWRAVGLNMQIEMKENWGQIFDRGSPRGVRDWSNSAPFADPVSSIVNQHGPKGQQQQVQEWTNEEFNKLSDELESRTALEERRKIFRRMLEIIEREDPGYTVLHQTALFFGKRKNIEWKPSPIQSMDFRKTNLRFKA